MGSMHRIITALSRHHRSGGFGIHSPYAYNFVRTVLREPWPYYAYDYLKALRQAVAGAMRGAKGAPKIMGFKEQKMLFRLANYFQPLCILQVGETYGIAAASMMVASSSTQLCLYEPSLGAYPVIGQVMSPFLDRADCCDTMPVATADYAQALDRSGGTFFALINAIPTQADADALCAFLHESMLEGTGVAIVRGMLRSSEAKQVWQYCQQHMRHGQTYTNEQTGIVVASPKLQREDFLLWF